MEFMENYKINQDIESHIYKGSSNRYMIFCHGFGASEIRYKEYEQLFDMLRSDYNIVTFNFSKCKKCDYKKLDIENIKIWVKDLNLVINKIYTINYKASIYLCGISLGAWVTTLYSLEYNNVMTNICIGPVFSLNMSMGNSQGIAVQHVTKKKSAILNDIEVNKKFTLSLITNQPICLIIKREYNVPTLLVIGEKDNIFRKTDAIIMEELLMERGVLVNRIEISEGNHVVNNIESMDSCIKGFKEWSNIINN